MDKYKQPDGADTKTSIVETFDKQVRVRMSRIDDKIAEIATVIDKCGWRKTPCTTEYLERTNTTFNEWVIKTTTLILKKDPETSDQVSAHTRARPCSVDPC